MRRLVYIASALLLSGCLAAGPLAAPAFESATTVAGTASTTATGYIATESNKQLNQANIELIHAQAAMMEFQAREMILKREQLESERATVVGILRARALSEHDFRFADLAMWVDSGGDPQFAMKYLLDHESLHHGADTENSSGAAAAPVRSPIVRTQ